MYVAQNIERPQRYVVDPQNEELWTTDEHLDYKWKLVAGCKVWCNCIGMGQWVPIEISTIEK